MKERRVYFTRKGDALYAIVFGSSEKIVVPDVGAVRSVSLLGSDRTVVWTQKGRDIEIEMPLFRLGTAPCEHALVFRLVVMSRRRTSSRMWLDKSRAFAFSSLTSRIA